MAPAEALLAVELRQPPTRRQASVAVAPAVDRVNREAVDQAAAAGAILDK